MLKLAATPRICHGKTVVDNYLSTGCEAVHRDLGPSADPTAEKCIYPLWSQGTSIHGVMISFPASTWQYALTQKTTKRRPRNSMDSRVASRITPRLFLSDLYTARTAGNLERLGITHVVSALEVDVRRHFRDSVTVMHVPIRDAVDVDIARWFVEVVQFIQDALDADEKNKVLVSGILFAGCCLDATIPRCIASWAFRDLLPWFVPTWWRRRRCGLPKRLRMYGLNEA